MDRYEYALLRWAGDGTGQHRSCTFSHRPDWEKVSTSLSETLKRMGDEGWELVGLAQPFTGHGTLGNQTAPLLYAFKRALA